MIFLSLAVVTQSLAAQGPARTVAVTIDDLPTVSVVEQTDESRRRLTSSLLAAIAAHKVPAIGFVNENKLGPLGAPLASRAELLAEWLRAGLELGNHTRSHLSLHQVSLSDYEREIVQGDSAIRILMRPRIPRYFRHPFLHAGRDSLVRDSLHLFLAARGYTIAPVTIDNSDYIFAAAYDRRIAAGDSAGADSIGTSYVRYMEQVVEYYERQSFALLGRELAQTLLLHASAMNARYFGALATMLENRGYRFIAIDEALRDPAYQRPDRYYGRSGISWLHRWAITEGKKSDFFAGEPEVPGWVERASQR